jgi:hypothetical protein
MQCTFSCFQFYIAFFLFCFSCRAGVQFYTGRCLGGGDMPDAPVPHLLCLMFGTMSDKMHFVVADLVAEQACSFTLAVSWGAETHLMPRMELSTRALQGSA